MKLKWTGTKPTPAVIYVKGGCYGFDENGVLTLPDGLDEFVAPEVMEHMKAPGPEDEKPKPERGETRDVVGPDETD